MTANYLFQRLLLVLTFTTGLLDAATYLGLHGVFTANMTGNVIFVSLGLSGQAQTSTLRSTLALAGFASGACLTGLAQRGREPRPNADPLVALTLAVGSIVMVVTTMLLGLANQSVALLDALTFALAMVMGSQAIAARRVAVPDVTTVVITSTLAGLMGDGRWAANTATAPTTKRRMLAVLSMALGAASGALALKQSLVAAVGIAATVNTLVAVVAVVCWWRARPDTRDTSRVGRRTRQRI